MILDTLVVVTIALVATTLIVPGYWYIHATVVSGVIAVFLVVYYDVMKSHLSDIKFKMSVKSCSYIVYLPKQGLKIDVANICSSPPYIRMQDIYGNTLCCKV